MTAQAIEQSVQKLLEQEDEEIEDEQVEEPEEEEEEDEVEETNASEDEPVRSRRDQERARGFGDEEEKPSDDVSPTRRIDFDNLQFGSNYDLK